MQELGYPANAEDVGARYDHLSRHPDYLTCLAICDKEVVGLIGLHRIFLFENSGSCIRIGALIIRQAFRNRGIGSKLIAKAEEWAVQTGALMLFVNSGNREERAGAHRFYQALGYEPYSTGFKKKINADAAPKKE